MIFYTGYTIHTYDRNILISKRSYRSITICFIFDSSHKKNNTFFIYGISYNIYYTTYFSIIFRNFSFEFLLNYILNTIIY